MNVNRVPKTLPRREFLRLGSTAVVGVAAAGLFDFNSLFAEAANLPLLSIGFAGSVPEAGHAVGLTAASSLLTSDPAFLGRAPDLRDEREARARLRSLRVASRGHSLRASNRALSRTT